METCVRGFSFRPETKVDDLKYVASEALERTWKTTRRERLKQQEQRIWEEFVNEQDIVHNICKDDPYQFLNQLPQECIKELLDVELQKMKDEKDEDLHIEEQPANSMAVELGTQHTVVFSEAADKEDSNMFNIFDDDKDEVFGPDEERCDNDSVISPPCTVRERHGHGQQSEQWAAVDSPDKTSRKSSGEDMTSMIEGSVYCAKVRDIRIKVNEELLNIIDFLEKQDIMNMDPSDIPKLMKRSVEFCARFNRVHMYQLQRQLADIERCAGRALPFARRTHHQAQLVRAGSLHHNLLHALQVFHKSLPQTVCMKESGDMLRSLVHVVGEATRVCSDARPNTLPAAVDMFDDSIQSTCEKLEETVNEYSIKMMDYMNSTENTSAPCSRRSSKPKARKLSIGTWSKSGSKSMVRSPAALSMYSLGGASGSKDKQSSSGTSKMRTSISSRSNKEVPNKEVALKSPKKTPRSRRPLMRAPPRTRPRRVLREQDVRTLVETVAPCTSSHISREASPQRRSKEATPRTPKPKEPSRTPVNTTPRNRPANIIARNKMAATSPVKPTPNNTRAKERINTPRTLNEIASGKVRVPINKNEVDDAKIKKEETRITMKERDKSSARSPRKTEAELKPANEEAKRTEREMRRGADLDPASCEVTRLVRQVCGGDNIYGVRSERSTGAKNAQLLCVNGGSPRQPSTPRQPITPRQPSTPQLLRILEETIQKKTPRSLFPKQPVAVKDAEKFRMSFNIPERVSDALFQYRTKFVQHMLTSSMYANSSVGKPWEKIGSVSEKIIDELLLKCANQMELQKLVDQMYRDETC